MPRTSSFSASSSNPSHHPDRAHGNSTQGGLKILTWLAVVGLCCLYGGREQAWGDVGLGEKKAIVAAGFGYQIGSVSTIAVKVYEAESGAILSDDVYELTVKEGDRSGGGQEPRVFAGGVGQGATDLSNFMLRVYDANTGAFQWEGRLNLVQPGGKGEGQAISTTLARRATVTKISVMQKAPEQPVFSLRALDALTGSLVWEDEFTTALNRNPRIQPTVDRSSSLDPVSTNSDHTFEFRIRMYDPSGQRILWEDQLSRSEPDQETPESFSDQAQFLPVWPHQPPQESTAESI